MSNFKTNYEKYLVDSMNSKSLFKTLLLHISSKLENEIDVLVSYPGNKEKFKNELNEVYSMLSKGRVYETIIDGFCGTGGSIKALEPSLLKSGVKKIVMNDISPCVITLHENVRNASQDMIDEYVEIIRVKVIQKYQKLFLTLDEFEEILTELKEEFNTFQKSGEFGVKTSVIFMMLSSFNYSGIVDFKVGGNINLYETIYDGTKVRNFLFGIPARIKEYSRLYNQFEMVFYNEDYFRLYEALKHSPKTLWNIDTVYVKENYSEYIQSEMEKLRNSDIAECYCNYGQKKFPHIEVLETLEDINFIYNNNTHPILTHYKNKFNLNSIDFLRNDNINADNKKKAKKIKEEILFQNNFPNKAEV